MSEVISFRLNPDNPREAKTLEILRIKQAEGFSSRRVLTNALIVMEVQKWKDDLFSFNEFNKALEGILDMLELVKNGNQGQDQSTHPQVFELNSNFLSSVKIAARSGLILD